MERAEILATLRSLPDQVDALCEGLSDEQLRWRPSPGEWSILEVCCHLRDFSEIGGERIRSMLEEENPFLPAYDQEVLARERNYGGDDPRRVRTALRAFSGGLAYLLEGLNEEHWRRQGRHEERGPMTLADMAQLLAEHARAHLEQVRGVRGRIG